MIKNNDVEGLEEEKQRKWYKKIIGLGLILTLIKVNNNLRVNLVFCITIILQYFILSLIQ